MVAKGLQMDLFRWLIILGGILILGILVTVVRKKRWTRAISWVWKSRSLRTPVGGSHSPKSGFSTSSSVAAGVDFRAKEGGDSASAARSERTLLEIKDELARVNQNLTELLTLLSANNLRLEEAQQSFLSNIHRLFSSNSNALLQMSTILGAIANATAKQKAASDVSLVPRPSSEKRLNEIARLREADSPTPVAIAPGFDELILRYRDQINEASTKGISAVRKLIEEIGASMSIDVEKPSDSILILVNNQAKPTTIGKAFVFPGTYLGRPWVDWFDMPKGVFERVEATVEPATVTSDRNGDWHLTNKGCVIQK
jgi:hypothetical protein